MSSSERIGSTEGEFSVAVFYSNDTHEYTRRWVSPKEAFENFLHHCQSVGAKLGYSQRVIITDGLDFTNMEWKWKDGIVFPADEPIRGRFKKGIDS